MDCKTARLLLDYARPNSRELDATEARALEAHLAGCADCDHQARAERRADDAIGQAMRRVDVPDRLRARILVRLKEDRVEPRRRWIVYGLRAAIAAAAMLLLALGLWRWYAVRPSFPAERLLTDANNMALSPPDQEQVRQAFKGQGVETAPPPDVNYSYLSWMFLANVEGRQTPLLQFNNRSSDARRPQQALVYIVSDNQFDANALPPHLQVSNEYEYKCAVRHVTGAPYGYVIYYTGDNLGWLDPPVASSPVSDVGN